MRQKLPFNFFGLKMHKNKKQRVLLTFDCLSKNVKNAILTYKVIDKLIDKKLMNVHFVIRQ